MILISPQACLMQTWSALSYCTFQGTSFPTNSTYGCATLQTFIFTRGDPHICICTYHQFTSISHVCLMQTTPLALMLTSYHFSMKLSPAVLCQRPILINFGRQDFTPSCTNWTYLQWWESESLSKLRQGRYPLYPKYIGSLHDKLLQLACVYSGHVATKPISKTFLAFLV